MFDGGNGGKIVEGDDRGGFEAAGDLVDCVILGDLEDVEEGDDVTLSGIEGEAISEDRED